MDILGQSALIVSLTSLAWGSSVLARNVRNKLYLSFSALCFSIFIWAGSFFVEAIRGDGHGYRVHLLANIWLGPFSLFFIHMLVRSTDLFSKRLLSMSVFLSGVVSLGWTVGFEHRSHWFLQIIYYSPIVVFIQVLALLFFQSTHGNHAAVGFKRRTWIYAGGLLVLSISVMDHVPGLSQGIPTFGNLALAVYLFFLSQAVTQSRLLNISALFSRTLVLASVALILTVLYSALVVWIQNKPALFLLNSFFASFLILTLLEPIRRAVAYFSVRLLTSEQKKLSKILRDAEGLLSGTVETRAIYDRVINFIENSLKPKSVSLFVLTSEATKFKRIRHSGDSSSFESLREVLSENPLLEFVEKLTRRGELPVVLDQTLENEMDRSASRAERDRLIALRQALRALGGNLLIPFLDGSRVLGFVLVDAPKAPEPWEDNWGLLQMIYPYFVQVGSQLKNLEVYVRQKEKERLATVGEMAAGLAHEIRNPLGAIKGAAQLLESSDISQRHVFSKVIVEEVDRLNKVVSQFLELSKPFTVDIQSVSLRELTEKVLNLIMTEVESQPENAKSKKIQWVRDFTLDPIRAQCSPEQITQVVLNLLRNSIKAVECISQPKIKIGLQSKHNQVFVSIEDNGIGIKKEHLDKLFIPFFTTSPTGTGLGLSISHKIIESHRGRIEVLSEENRMTRFTVILPI